MDDQLSDIVVEFLVKPFLSSFAAKIGQQSADTASTYVASCAHKTKSTNLIIKQVYVLGSDIFMQDVSGRSSTTKVTRDAIHWAYCRIPPNAEYAGYVFLTETGSEYFTNGKNTWHLPLGTE